MSLCAAFSTVPRCTFWNNVCKTVACQTPKHHQARCLSSVGRQPVLTVPASKKKYVPTTGTYPVGFHLASTHLGISPSNDSKPDLVLVESDRPASGAAVFTRNEFPAASVTVSKEILERSRGHELRGIIANSGCANLFTGPDGLEDAKSMSIEASRCVNGSAAPDLTCMVMHTGSGGHRLPIQRILRNIPKLHENAGNSYEHWLNAAWGICTTDTFPKMHSRTFTLPSSPGKLFTIAGITKGAGMIHPNMATTLGIICTDAPVSPTALQQLLSYAADRTYNCISIEGDTSTNDMVVMLANGAAGGVQVEYESSKPSQSEDFACLQLILTDFMTDMAKLVVRDGEGSTKFVTIRVRGSPSKPAAKHIASVIARSVLLKAGVYTREPIWGNVLVALGYSLLDTAYEGQGIIVREMTSVTFIPVDSTPALKVLERGVPIEVDNDRMASFMDADDLEVVVDLRDDGSDSTGVDEAVYWTCDMIQGVVPSKAD